MLRLKDGGEVALDWLVNGCAVDAPIIIILPGLTGESQAEYIKCLVSQASQMGIKCVVFNNRGLGGMILKTPRLYCAANCEDLSEVVNHVHNKHPGVKKGATGISMGGLILGETFPRKSKELFIELSFIHRQLLIRTCGRSQKDSHSSENNFRSLGCRERSRFNRKALLKLHDKQSSCRRSLQNCQAIRHFIQRRV